MKKLYNKIANFLCSFTSDKYVHFIVCMLEKWKNAVNSNPVPEGTDWHLSSVVKIGDSIMFLKKGRDAIENPELEGEFDFYNSNPDFQKKWYIEYVPDENRNYYRRRK